MAISPSAAEEAPVLSLHLLRKILAVIKRHVQLDRLRFTFSFPNLSFEETVSALLLNPVTLKFHHMFDSWASSVVCSRQFLPHLQYSCKLY